jgi:hypothetical protein
MVKGTGGVKTGMTGHTKKIEYFKTSVKSYAWYATTLYIPMHLRYTPKVTQKKVFYQTTKKEDLLVRLLMCVHQTNLEQGGLNDTKR